MTGVRAGLMLMMAIAACSPAATPKAPPARPSAFVAHAEPPIGDALNRRLVRAMTGALDRLEPEWGKLQGRLYTVAPDAGALAPLVARDLPPGWTRLDLGDVQLRDAELVAWHSGDALYAVLRVDPKGGAIVPAMVLRNDATLALSSPQ
ncbi:hypothetical protein GO308_00245 [Sphingomonas sp. SFZ2018-12]|uniref:hypothetical protein n=1 Tax=Sphingomonas sp. SFZ2018-12 TaxID=2683197 RepID=UPI001F100E9B|nr:hypothetical protein [Sphingomonas sp. SFZ2018-12]MCH4891535.1 hypothetical protein [Sphingomonas sp. SFZ2018-12]